MLYRRRSSSSKGSCRSRSGRRYSRRDSRSEGLDSHIFAQRNSVRRWNDEIGVWCSAAIVFVTITISTTTTTRSAAVTTSINLPTAVATRNNTTTIITVHSTAATPTTLPTADITLMTALECAILCRGKVVGASVGSLTVCVVTRRGARCRCRRRRVKDTACLLSRLLLCWGKTCLTVKQLWGREGKLGGV